MDGRWRLVGGRGKGPSVCRAFSTERAGDGLHALEAVFQGKRSNSEQTTTDRLSRQLGELSSLHKKIRSALPDEANRLSMQYNRKLAVAQSLRLELIVQREVSGLGMAFMMRPEGRVLEMNDGKLTTFSTPELELLAKLATASVDRDFPLPAGL
jgi:hypothetical protein